MAYIISPKPWHESRTKSIEEADYWNRRELIKKMGLATGALMMAPSLLSACSNKKGSAQKSPLQEQADSFTFKGMSDLYPAQRNKKYTLDRPMTEEYDATHYNNFYEFIHPADKNIYNVYKYINQFDTSDWKFEVTGLAENTGEFYLGDIIQKIGLEERTYRFRCVERWSMAVPWTGFPLAKLVKFLQPIPQAKYIRMETYANPEQMPGVKNQSWYPWPYFEGLTIEEAMNELTLIATGIYGKPLPKQNGAPMRLVVPWKYGYKNIKSIIRFEFLDYEPETFWHKIAPHEYPFQSNIDPDVPHPQWSQAIERMIPDGEPRKTLKYNGYGAYVAHMYG